MPFIFGLVKVAEWPLFSLSGLHYILFKSTISCFSHFVSRTDFGSGYASSMLLLAYTCLLYPGCLHRIRVLITKIFNCICSYMYNKFKRTRSRQQNSFHHVIRLHPVSFRLHPVSYSYSKNAFFRFDLFAIICFNLNPMTSHRMYAVTSQRDLCTEVENLLESVLIF